MEKGEFENNAVRVLADANPKKEKFRISLKVKRILGFAASALASTYFEEDLKPFHGKTWCESRLENGDVRSFYVEVVNWTSNDGRFWVNDKNAALYGQAWSNGPFVDKVVC